MAGSMNKTEFIDELANATGLSKADAGRFLGAFEDIVTAQVKKGNKVTTRLDPRPDGTIGRQPRIVGERSDFAKTFRGRPKGSTKKAATVTAPVDVLSTPPQASAVAPAALPANSSSGLGL